MNVAYIVAAARTAGGRRGGRLSGWHPADLAGEVINSLLARSGADPGLVEDVIMGCVSQLGEQSSNVARNAVLASKLPESVPATSIDRQCGSSQQALHFAAQAVMSGSMDIVIAAGVESMSRVPMGLSHTLPEKNGFGQYVSPAMQSRYPGVQFSQFAGAEAMARKYDLSKNQLDEFALHSHQLAIAATRAGKFNQEIVPVTARSADGSVPGDLHTADEGIRYEATLDSIGGVKLISDGGRVTAATASQICDGAAGVMVVNGRGLRALGIEPLVRVHHMTVIGHDPVIMLEAPIPATQLALKKAGMKIDDIDLFEVNEAFAPVPLAWLRETGADPARLNVHGGAIALGHPLGASGTKLMTTLIYALKERGKRYGLQTMCEGGGLANVTIIERL
ncbi:MAG: acetyl-CoA C-acetyltransferase [Gammaproteobacteria bacterium]|jgi:acetyl-CoA C-acetyltransferase|nr:acetyl-CoA C-acetyltransferase [Gammaproteobacteria bacterium]